MPTSRTEARVSSSRSRAKASPRRVNAATLAGLGAERLADLLAAAAKTDAVLKRALTLEVAIEPERLAEELDRQITRMRTSTGRLTAVRAAKLAREVAHLVDVAAEKLGGSNAVGGALRLFDITSLGPSLLGRRTGEGGPLLEALLSVPQRAADLVARMPEADQARIIDPMHQAFLADPRGVAARLPAQVGAALRPPARRMLREVVEAELAASAGAVPDLVALTTVLGQIADTEGDVNAFLSAQQRRAAPLRDHVGSARRLLDVGRVTEAAALLDAAPAGAVVLLGRLRRASDRDPGPIRRWRGGAGRTLAALPEDAVGQGPAPAPEPHAGLRGRRAGGGRPGPRTGPAAMRPPRSAS